MNEVMLISDAAKEVNVENHVLRYWEEELHLPIKRNELGHRYYTKDDIERFKRIKSMKERGLQLKAIKMILKNGKIDIFPPQELPERRESDETIKKMRDDKCANDEKEERDAKKESNEKGTRDGKRESNEKCMTEDKRVKEQKEIMDADIMLNRATEKQENESEVHMAINIVDSSDAHNEVAQNSREEKAKRLQWLLQQLIRETLQENNQQLCNDIRESVVKELDYQFRVQEERDEEKERKLTERNEEYYKKMDEILRLKREKKKRHFIF